MKRYYFSIYILLLGSLLFILTGCANNNNNSSNNSDSSGSRISTVTNEINTSNENTLSSNQENPSTKPNQTEEISSYSTVIQDNSSGRLTNINITCSILNDTIIHSGETFSFNTIVGKPTIERGYQEASVIIEHKTEKGIGGGNCQVSSTLYNAVLAIPSLVVTERHEHGKTVSYVPKGKDAAVSYGSLDLKFRNDTGHDVKILATTDNQNITIKLIKLF